MVIFFLIGGFIFTSYPLLAQNCEQKLKLANKYYQEGKIELYQKKIKAGSEKKAPIYDYIARKLKTNEKSNNN